jgi:hypothetical protein
MRYIAVACCELRDAVWFSCLKINVSISLLAEYSLHCWWGLFFCWWTSFKMLWGFRMPMWPLKHVALGRWVHFCVANSLFGLACLILPAAVVLKRVIICPLSICFTACRLSQVTWFWMTRRRHGYQLTLSLILILCLLIVGKCIVFSIVDQFEISALQWCTIKEYSFYSGVLSPSFSTHSLFAFGSTVLCSSLSYFAVWSGYFDQLLFLLCSPRSFSRRVYFRSDTHQFTGSGW